MAKFTGKFESAKQDWETPIGLFNTINDRFKFTFDLAASKENSKCNKFFSREEDSISRSWSGLGCCWLNPPYGDTSKNKLSCWIKKAYQETEKDETLWVSLLIPARTNTKWFLEYCLKKAFEISFIIGRPKFGGATHGLPQPLVLVTFKKHEENDEIDYPKISYFEV